MFALRALLWAMRGYHIKRKTGINSLRYWDRKLTIGFKKPTIEGSLALGDVSSDIYGHWDSLGFHEKKAPGPVWGFMLKFRW